MILPIRTFRIYIEFIVLLEKTGRYTLAFKVFTFKFRQDRCPVCQLHGLVMMGSLPLIELFIMAFPAAFTAHKVCIIIDFGSGKDI
jgi:hypothetical protein